MATEYTGEIIPFTEYTGEVIQEEPSALSQIGKGAMKYLVRPANELAGAVLEPAAQMATGFGAKPIGELAALGTMAANQLTGNEVDPAAMARTVQEQLTYQPRTQLGQAVSENILAPISGAMESGAGAIAKPLSFGNEIAEAGIKEALLQGAGLAGVKGAPKVGARIESANKQRIEALKEQKAFEAERNRIRDEGKDLGLLAPAESGIKRQISGLGQANKFQSFKNRQTATKIFAEEVGIKKKGSINDADISNRVNELTSNYGAVEKALGNKVTITPEFKSDVSFMLSDMENKIRQNPTAYKGFDSVINDLKTQLSLKEMDSSVLMDSIRKFRETARLIDKRKEIGMVEKEAGEANYKLANMYENMIEQKLGNKKALLDKFRDARKKLAQIHILDAVRMDDGLIDPKRLDSVIGKYKSDQKFATGKIKTLKEFANTFDEVMAPITKSELPTTSKWEVAAAGAGLASGLGGNLAGLTLAIPAGIRSVSPMLAERGLLQGATPSYDIGMFRKSLGLLEPSLRATPFIANQQEEQ